MRRLHWGPANCPITSRHGGTLETITSAAIVGALCVGGLVAPAATDAYLVAPTAVMAPTTGPVRQSQHPKYRNGPEFPETRDAGTFSTPSDCQRAGDKLVSNRTARSYNCTLGPNATYKLRINPKFDSAAASAQGRRW